ncbi:MAG TPA: hypothetical protein H9830_04335, partial [Candidatus Agrococcus pullicola]|nr:hypothetical protein [Candidatus Agrococcus pullicola]
MASPADSHEFGANEWLVDEQYELYRQDKNKVAKSWWPILERYAAQRSADPGANTPPETASESEKAAPPRVAPTAPKPPSPP